MGDQLGGEVPPDLTEPLRQSYELTGLQGPFAPAAERPAEVVEGAEQLRQTSRPSTSRPSTKTCPASATKSAHLARSELRRAERSDEGGDLGDRGQLRRASRRHR